MTHNNTSSELSGGNKPPLCNKDKFTNIKVWIQAYIDIINDELFGTVLNEPYIPTKLSPTAKNPNKVVIKQRVE